MDIENVILLLSVISTLVATIASVAASLITAHYAMRQKSLELLFNEKSLAYAKVLELTSDIPISDDLKVSDEYAKQLYAAICKAQIFSSEHTSQALAEYGLLVLHVTDSRVDADQFARAYKETILAMRDELTSFKKLHHGKSKQC